MKKFCFYIVVVSLFLVSSCSSSEKVALGETSNVDSLATAETLFGFNLNEYSVEYDTVQSGWTWNNLLTKFALDQYTINQTAQRAKDSLIGLKYICAGQPIEIFTPKNSKKKHATHLVYELSPLTYLTFDFSSDSIQIKRIDKPVEHHQKTISGVIEKNSSLYETLNDKVNSYNLTTELSQKIEGIYAWSVDFFHLQVGDKFVIAYDVATVDGQPYSISKINYAWFEHAGHGNYAFYYKDTINNISGYYDDSAKAMKRRFLKSPLKHFYITSHYSKSRFHPILKVRRSHLGTDFAAPMGTPIHATADGVVERASYTGGNGNYVKIRHNAVYETQYLHMSKIAKDIHPGVHVEQDQVIGYVGMTGLATGPHVCYRFWKNGRQVDPFKQEFPNTEPMVKEAIPAYLKFIAPLKNKLEQHIQQLNNQPKEIV